MNNHIHKDSISIDLDEQLVDSLLKHKVLKNFGLVKIKKVVWLHLEVFT
jgi:hypothetical protein